ncbi:ABC transporter substrate-binding protein [Pseudomonas sp. ENNP23]|uniref:substrate-binding periplasmic protein n=1 Tax=Pseudomonas sp. ENNP23 TaxID=1535636 RepID=UPI00084A84C5|nr:transporter substrate-binding domain-containing protein [Pseudomonas sp. ENNP23]OEC62003.1 amino acid ABC transporter substrate-binding protein [Pseudomonas sp. ENNP23]
MTKTLRLLFLFLFLLLGAAGLRAEPLRLAGDVWPPFTDARLPGNGLAVQLVEAALQRAGYTTKYFEVPWARVLQGVQVGDYDVVVSAWYKDDRVVYGLYSEPYLVNRIRFVQRRGAGLHYTKLDDLLPYSLAVVRGYAYFPGFDQDARLKRLSVVGFEMGARMVAAGRVNLTLEDELVARYHFGRGLKGIRDELEFLPQPLSENNLAILVRRSLPQHREVVERFNRALQEMREDGTYQRILDAQGL